MLAKQISGLLLTAALQQLAYAFPLDATVNDLSLHPPTTWCTSAALPLPYTVTCIGSIFYCHAGYIGFAAGGCVQDENGLWVPSRKWTPKEALDYILSGGSKLPPP